MVAVLIERLVYYDLEEVIYRQHNQYLFDVQLQVHQQMAAVPQTQWQRLASKLESEYNTISQLRDRITDELDGQILDAMAQDANEQGFIDLEMATLYYPLDDSTVLELGPIPFESSLVMLADMLPWLSAFTINGLLLLSFILWHRLIQSRDLADLKALSVPIDPALDWQGNLKTVQQFIHNMQQESQTRLVLQRDLLHGVAHEFRSPMARIQFALDMLEEADETERPQLQHSIHAALDDLDALVKELLYYARLKDGNTKLSNEQVHLDDLILAALDKVQPFYSHIQFELIPSPLLTIVADPNLLQRALINLLRNAGRFAQSHCRISSGLSADILWLLIEDDGMGIPPGKRERIFEPFTRLDPSRSRDSGGCGLGLAIVASIAAKHGGTVELLESTPQTARLAGACFRIQLPLRNSDIC